MECIVNSALAEVADYRPFPQEIKDYFHQNTQKAGLRRLERRSGRINSPLSGV